MRQKSGTTDGPAPSNLADCAPRKHDEAYGTVERGRVFNSKEVLIREPEFRFPACLNWWRFMSGAWDKWASRV